jgi:hypothetical protein
MLRSLAIFKRANKLAATTAEVSLRRLQCPKEHCGLLLQRFQPPDPPVECNSQVHNRTGTEFDMPIPNYTTEGLLPPGIYAATLKQIGTRYGEGSEARRRLSVLLREVVEAAKSYPSMKRILLWGSFITRKDEPNDLDYSVIVSVDHRLTEVAPAHRRFFVPSEARRRYGVDAGYLLIRDYPLEPYVERLDFICKRKGVPCGIIEISLRGEMVGE